ncbi:hypothetical protein JXL19_05510 [bacterium]|nr:hypothetical protein [bacterium]
MCEEHRVSEFLHRLVAAGWGFVSLSEEKAKKFIDELITRGEISAKEGEGLLKGILDRLESTGKDIETRVAEMVSKYIKRENICTKSDIDQLIKRIEKIEKKLDSLDVKNK